MLSAPVAAAELTKKARLDKDAWGAVPMGVMSLERCVCFMLDLLGLGFAVDGMAAPGGVAGVLMRLMFVLAL
jgi:hypothetical protein